MDYYERDFIIIMLWFEQLLAAVVYLHDKGKVHRNLKVAEVLELLFPTTTIFIPPTFTSQTGIPLKSEG